MQRPEDVGGSLPRLDREVGASDVADEERVAGQHRPRLAAAAGVAQEEAGVLGPVPGRVERLDREVAQLQGPVVGERLMLVLGLRQLVDVDRRPGRPCEAAVPGGSVGRRSEVRSARLTILGRPQ